MIKVKRCHLLTTCQLWTQWSWYIKSWLYIVCGTGLGAASHRWHLHRVWAGAGCCVPQPFLLLHREHATGYRQSWNCCDRRTRFGVIWKHFCFILFMGTRIRIDSVMRPRSSSRRRNTSASVTVTGGVYIVWCWVLRPTGGVYLCVGQGWMLRPTGGVYLCVGQGWVLRPTGGVYFVCVECCRLSAADSCSCC